MERTSRLNVTVVVENTAWERDTLGEHGLAYFVEADGHSLLYDTGQTPEVLAHNAARLGVDLGSIDAVVLSHGHYDHTGGLPEVVRSAPRARLYAHPRAFAERWSRHADGTGHRAGAPDPVLTGLLAQCGMVMPTRTVTEIVPGVFVTGEIPRETEYEDSGGDFYYDERFRERDEIVDDQALYFATDAGIVVLLGCAHAGVINTLRHITELTGGPIAAVIGGMHLHHASQTRMFRTIDALRTISPALIAAGHCTGAGPAARLRNEFPEAFAEFRVGARFSFTLRTE